jgi:DNA-binding transcriptional MocR family regulator
LQDYHPAEGAAWARQAGKKWIELSGMKVSTDRMVVTSGAQEGLFIVLSAVTRPGDVVLTNQVTYYGMKALADLLHLNIQGLPTDGSGLLPGALEEACRDSRVRAVFSVPCIHNPTAITVPQERREEIVAVAKKYGLYIIEDDVYGPLLEVRPSPIAALYPERTFYVTGTSKTLAPGLRVGYVFSPKGMVAPIADAVRATCWMVSPLSQLIATQWIEDGTALQLIAGQRRELMARQARAQEILGAFDFSSSPVSTHLWLHLPPPWRATEFAAQAQARGVKVLPSEIFVVGRAEMPHAIRINLGAAHSHEELVRGLNIIVSTLKERPKAILPATLP